MTTNESITLITGANRGMGLEIAKELGQKGQHVLMGARNLERGQEAAETLSAQGINATAIQLDVTDPASIAAAADQITKQFGVLNILINNAGAVFDFGQAPSNVRTDTLEKDFAINYFGTINVIQAMLPLLKKSPKAKIINVSSMMGSISSALESDSPVYNAVAVGYQSAKAALNMYTVQLAKELQKADLPITVNAIDPGMVATEFGGATPEQAKNMGAMPIEQGVARTVELASDWDNTDTATFTNTKGKVEW